jgi:hypothetical protein
VRTAFARRPSSIQSTTAVAISGATSTIWASACRHQGHWTGDSGSGSSSGLRRPRAATIRKSQASSSTTPLATSRPSGTVNVTRMVGRASAGPRLVSMRAASASRRPAPATIRSIAER